EVELVAFELQAQCLPAEVADAQAAAEAAVVQLQVQVAEAEAVRGAGQAAGQLETGQAAAFAHGRQGDAEAVEEFAQVELGQRQAAFQFGRLVEVAQFEFAKRAQLVGGEFDAGPLGYLGGLVDE